MQDIHSEAAGTKRARLEASDFQVLDDGAPVQSMREEFPRTMRLPSHNRAAEGGTRWQGQPPAQHLPPHGRWAQFSQWSQDGPEYNDDGYVIEARPRNWQDGNYNASHWQDGGGSYDHRRSGQWRDRAHMPRPNAPRTRYPAGRGHVLEQMYVDRDGHQIQHPVRRSMYREGERLGYGRAPTRYADHEPLVGDAPPLLPPDASSSQAHDTDRPPACTPNVIEDVYSIDFLNPESSALKNIPTAEDPAQPEFLYKQGRQTMQLVYEKEEYDRIARGQKPFWVECNSAGIAIETGRGGSRFVEVFRALCVAILDVSVIRVRDQNIEDYAALREKLEADFEFVGHPMSDDGFFHAVSKCMKAERSRLHKLYTTRRERGCPPKEQPEVWDRLKTYWRTLEFGKAAKVGSTATQIATTSEDVPVSTDPRSTLIYWFY